MKYSRLDWRNQKQICSNREDWVEPLNVYIIIEESFLYEDIISQKPQYIEKSVSNKKIGSAVSFIRLDISKDCWNKSWK